MSQVRFILQKGGNAWADFDMPKGTNCIVLCKMGQYQMETISILLPHQIYLDELRKLGDEFMIIPYNSDQTIGFKLSDIL